MLNLIVYCKDHKRKPIYFGRYPFFHDTQGQLPFHWCPECGSEIFDDKHSKCLRCRNGKGV